MDILRPTELVSTAFVIYPGKQVTLYATGLVGDDKAIVELLHLSRAPEFTGNPCCVVTPDIAVLASTPLKCSDGNAIVMTAEYPWVTIDAPQNVPLRVVLAADTAALVTVELHETESDGCLECTCRCYDETWTDTGQQRCLDGNVEFEERSNCGTLRWVVERPQAWVATGEQRCYEDNVEFQEVNDCGDLRWVVDRSQTWTETGVTRCVDFLVQNEERNDCGDLRWVITTIKCGYCPSLRLSCSGGGGYGFHTDDPKDPDATVEMAPCPDDNSVDSLWIYPSAGPGHTVKVLDCDGVVIGYAANKSDCAEDCGCPETTVNVAAPRVQVGGPTVRIDNNIPVPSVTVENNITAIAPLPTVLSMAYDGDNLVITMSDGTTRTAPPNFCP